MTRTTGPTSPERLDVLLRQHATPRQIEILDAIAKHGSGHAADAALGISRGLCARTMRRLKARVADTATELHRDADETAPGQRIKGTSTAHRLWDEDSGKWITHWVKTERDPHQERFEAMIAGAEAIAGLALPETKRPMRVRADLLSCLPIGDPHFGLYAWGCETGQQDFDLKIAQRQWRTMIDEAVDALPYCERGVLIQLGDLTHGNDHKNVTPQSGHSLDVDSRHQLVMRAAASAMYYGVERMRTKCDVLDVEMIPGNHSPETVMALTIALEAYFRNAPDVRISMNARDIRLVAEFGNVMITSSHGDKQKPERLGSLVPAHYPEAWGRTKRRYHHGGHVHHTHVKDIDGIRFESHRSPAPMDAYAAAKFWSEQSTDAIVYHREKGEIARHRVGII
jgi:hypothetical protein